jgi:ATP-binding cassette subfamily B (MDR/TAP) protein 1
VGESGSGKSTIFALVERFYDPDDGQVLIDGVDLRELDPKWYHRQVAIVSQEPILFSGSIKENIMYGKEDATDAEVMEAARAGM